jgi:PASTA domain
MTSPRRTRTVLWLAVSATCVASVLVGPRPVFAAHAVVGHVSAQDGADPVVRPDCRGLEHTGDLLAVTVHGVLDAVTPRTGRFALVASGVARNGGVAVRPQLDVAYVTATGPDGRDAIWSVPLVGCHPTASMVEPDAELPSVSPDGGYLGVVTLNHRGEQTGAAIVGLGRRGQPVAPARRYAATSTPPPLPINGVAVGRRDAVLAVWGGFVDPYLGKKRVTVSTLVPSTARSLRALEPVFDERGISITPEAGRRQVVPKDWQSAPAYRPDGEFLVGDHGTGISMPFSTTGGGGMRTLSTDSGPLISLAAGPSGALAWVEKGGYLVVSPHAIELPFGPAAETAPRTTAAPVHLVPGRFTAVAWTIGPGAETTALPRVFVPIVHLPSVVGLSTAQATTVMAGLDLPTLVGRTVADPSVPAGTVVSQDPPAGDGVACQCSVDLTVAAGNAS